MKDTLKTYKMFNNSQSISILESVLFEFRTNLASYIVRSSSNHSHSYGFSNDRTIYLARFALILEPFTKYTGKI